MIFNPRTKQYVRLQLLEFMVLTLIKLRFCISLCIKFPTWSNLVSGILSLPNQYWVGDVDFIAVQNDCKLSAILVILV